MICRNFTWNQNKVFSIQIPAKYESRLILGQITNYQYLCITKQRGKCHAWSEGCLTFSVGWKGPSCETEAFPERTSVMSTKITTTTPPTEHNMEQGWHRNTILCADIKSFLLNEVLMTPGKDYPGILRHDIPSEEFGFDDEHYTFIETLHPTAGKRNPHVFEGRFVTITRRDDGSLRPNLKQMPKLGAKLSVDNYVFEVYRELRQGLKGLIEK